MDKNILLIEDSDALTKSITFNLSDSGYKVLSEKTTLGGRGILSKYKISLIIVDINLLNTANISTKEQLNITNDNNFLPIIILVDEERYLLEMNHWSNVTIIIKPFASVKLLNSIKNILV